MRNQKRGFAGAFPRQVFQNNLFGLDVHGRNGIVENQDRRVFHQGARNGNALLLPARHRHAALAQHRFVAFRKALDVGVHVGQAGGSFHVRMTAAVRGKGNVVFNGVAEQKVVLGDVGGRAAHGADGNRVHVPSVQKQRAVGHIVGAENQIDQRSLARTGLSDDAHVFAGSDREGHVGQRVVFGAGIAEGQMPKFNVALQHAGIGYVGAVFDMNFRFQKACNPVERGLALGAHLHQLGNGQNRPHHGGEIADKLNQLAGGEGAFVNQKAAVAEDDADDRFDKQRNADVEGDGELCEIDVGFFAFKVELAEGVQLLGLLDKGLDHGNAGKAFLRKIGQAGKGGLALFPAGRESLFQKGAAHQQDRHGDHGEQSEQRIHAKHVENGQNAEAQRVEEHKNARAEAILHRFQVVGEKGHQTAHLVRLIVLLRQELAAVEHPAANIGFHADGRAEEADAPQKAADQQSQNDKEEGQTDAIQKEVHVKGDGGAVNDDASVVDSVDDHAVKAGHQKLGDVHKDQRENAEQENGGVFEVISIDMLTKQHREKSPSLLKNRESKGRTTLSLAARRLLERKASVPAPPEEGEAVPGRTGRPENAEKARCGGQNAEATRFFAK